MPPWTPEQTAIAAVLAVLLAALIAAGASLAATALTMWWTGRHDAARQSREDAATLRAEKRVAYRDLVIALNRWREATVDVAEGGLRKKDWDAYWEARDASLTAGASLQLVGSEDMVDATSEAMEMLLDCSWKFLTHTELAFGDNPPTVEQAAEAIWHRVTVADREMDTLLDLMRADLGTPAFARQIAERKKRAERLPPTSMQPPSPGT
jgi:hypothetical protein